MILTTYKTLWLCSGYVATTNSTAWLLEIAANNVTLCKHSSSSRMTMRFDLQL